jgi:hypothetical protein
MKSLEAAPGRITNHDQLPAEERKRAARTKALIQRGFCKADVDLLESEAGVAMRIQQIRDTPPQSLSWVQLSELSRNSPELAAEKLGELQELAAHEIQSGQRASRAVSGVNGTPLERAKFLALRDELAREWNPRNGIERLLLFKDEAMTRHCKKKTARQLCVKRLLFFYHVPQTIRHTP